MTDLILDDYNLIAIGASAGGVEALKEVLSGLPSQYKIPIVVVLHLPPDKPSLLPELFRAWVSIPVVSPEDKDRIQPGTLYFASPGYHLMIEETHTFCLNLDDPVHFSLPSIDVLFESVANAFGSHAVGIILTGANEDGSEGLSQVIRKGGLGIVQSPSTARSPLMPASAYKKSPAALCLSLEEIGALLLSLKPGSIEGKDDLTF